MSTKELFHRSARIESRAPAQGEADARTADLTFSSEITADRWFGGEILDHSPDSVRMDFLGSGRAPLLLYHDPKQPVGVVQSANIGDDRKGHAVVRFGRSAAADQALQDVRDGILTNVSVGYRVHEMQLESTGDDGDVYRVTDWEPLEASLVTVPVDSTVGVGRSSEVETLITRAKEARKVTPVSEATPTPATPATPAAPAAATPAAEAVRTVVLSGDSAEGARLERARMREIQALAARHSLTKLAEEHIEKGTSIELFRGLVLDELDRRGSSKPLEVPAGDLDLSDKDRKRFSLMAAVRLQVARAEQKKVEKTFELECSQAIAQRLGREAQGIFLPYDALCARGPEGELSFFKRALTSSGGVGSGGALVQSTVLGSQYVPPNYNVPVVVDAGARVLSGLVGNVLIPAMTVGKSSTWITPENQAVSEGDPTFAQIALNPCDLGTVCDISRRLLLQSNPQVDGLVRDDIAVSIAEGVDTGAITGTGASGQPTGIMNQSGVAVISSGANGGPLTWPNVTYLPQSVGVANRLIKGAPVAFITNWQAWGHALRTPKLGTTFPTFIGEYEENDLDEQGENAGTIGGIPVHISQNVPSNLTKGSGTSLSAMLFGNWADLLIGEWGVLDMLVDPYTFSNTGAIRIRAIITVSVAVRYGVAFAQIKDIVTT